MMGFRLVYMEIKLNLVFFFGGFKCLVKVIQKLLGLSINWFIVIDFVGFVWMVEVFGGVEVCSIILLWDYELGMVLEYVGCQVIDGLIVLNYVCVCQVIIESNGDYGCIKCQQLFLLLLLCLMILMDILFNFSRFNNVVNMFIGNSYVDNVKIKDLVEFG